MNGHAVESVDDIQRILTEWPIVTAMPIVLLRGTKLLTFEIVPAESKP